MAFSSHTVSAAFYILSFPGLLPGQRGLISQLPSTSVWIDLFRISMLAIFLWAAATVDWPRPVGQAERRAFWLAIAILVVLAQLYRREQERSREVAALYRVTDPGLARLGLVRLLAVVRDITELMELDRLKDQYLTTAAHELKTPVTGIKGYAQLLLRRERAVVSPSGLKALEAVNRQADRITRIVNDLLQITSIPQT